MPFKIKKNPTKWTIAGTGSGWDLMPMESDRIVCCLNDFVKVEKFQTIPDYLFIMDILDEKPLVVSGIDNLGDLVKRINDMKVPLISPVRYEEIPLSQEFPLEEVVEKFGQPYFLNTIAYMIAFALLKGAKDINIYGVNQASSSEYFYEKSSVEYWLGVANGMGVKITIHGEKSELLSNKSRFGGSILYGYNQTYENFLRSNEKYGRALVKKLAMPSKPLARIVRQINHETKRPI